VNELRTWHQENVQEELMTSQIIAIDGGSTIVVPSMEDAHNRVQPEPNRGEGKID